MEEGIEVGMGMGLSKTEDGVRNIKETGSLVQRINDTDRRGEQEPLGNMNTSYQWQREGLA